VLSDEKHVLGGAWKRGCGEPESMCGRSGEQLVRRLKPQELRKWEKDCMIIKAREELI
jgi:hypothetical protein